MNTKEITTAKEYYTQLQSVVSLQNDYEDILMDNMWITGIYSIFPEKKINIVKADSVPYKAELTEYIQSQIDSKEVSLIGTWKIIQFSDTTLLILMSNYKNAYYGAWIDLNELANTLNLKDSNDGNIKVLTDDSGNVLYTNKNGLEKIDLNNISRRYDGVNYVLVKAQSNYVNLELVQIMPKSQITKTLPLMIQILQVASIVALGILPIIMFSMQKWIVHPINSLSRAMEKIEAGDMEVRVKEEKSGSEFEQINRNFNHMMDEVSKLKIDVYEEKLEKQQIKMRFLSQQIQPHFILNAMNILYSYEKEEYPLIHKMILCLSKYFRYVVNANTDFVELSQEMNHIKNYFEIQQARYPDSFFCNGRI